MQEPVGNGRALVAGIDPDPRETLRAIREQLQIEQVHAWKCKCRKLPGCGKLNCQKKKVQADCVVYSQYKYSLMILIGSPGSVRDGIVPSHGVCYQMV